MLFKVNKYFCFWFQEQCFHWVLFYFCMYPFFVIKIYISVFQRDKWVYCSPTRILSVNSYITRRICPVSSSWDYPVPVFLVFCVFTWNGHHGYFTQTKLSWGHWDWIRFFYYSVFCFWIWNRNPIRRFFVDLLMYNLAIFFFVNFVLCVRVWE